MWAEGSGWMPGQITITATLEEQSPVLDTTPEKLIILVDNRPISLHQIYITLSHVKQ